MDDCRQDRQHRVVAVAYDGLCTFEFGIAVEAFGLPRPEFDFPWYDFRVASIEPQIRAVGGFTMQTEGGIELLDRADTIVIPGWRRIEAPAPGAFLEALRRAHDRGTRLMSFCSGVFVLAEAGLMNGREATTHWKYIPKLREVCPDLTTVDDVLYVESRGIISSAGSSAAIDACLHVIRSDHGARVANRVARGLVMPPHREGGQSQYIEAPIQERPGKSIADVMDWARANLCRRIEIGEMARYAGLSERTFLRRFREGAGLTPLKWLRRERIYRAMLLLETTNTSLDDVAVQCGFRSAETFRIAFREEAGTPPGAYRKRFRILSNHLYPDH